MASSIDVVDYRGRVSCEGVVAEGLFAGWREGREGGAVSDDGQSRYA